jgi:hypothetical protein
MAADDQPGTAKEPAAEHPRRRAAREHHEQAQAAKAEPFAYVAGEDLFIYDPESGAMPARAYAAGSLVPPADIQRHPEWAALVHEPEE